MRQAVSKPTLATLAELRPIGLEDLPAVRHLHAASFKQAAAARLSETEIAAFARHVTTPVVFEDMVCVASHQFGLIGIQVTADGDKCKAQTIWTQKDSAINFSSPVAIGQNLYGLGPAKNLICVDMKTGKQNWAKDSFLTGKADKAHVGMIVAGANLLVLTDDGQLVLVKVDPQEYHEISRLRVCGSNWCNPAYADGKLYLRDEKQLMCLSLAEK